MNKFLYLSVLILCLTFSSAAVAQQSNDSTAVVVDYTITPRDRAIASLRVTGSQTYEEYVLIGFSGLSIGQHITVPGKEISSAVSRFWKQGYFSQVDILVDKMTDDSVWLHIALKQRPRISQINYFGMKKSDQEDLEPKIGLTKGTQLTPDLIDRTKILVMKHLADKGYANSSVFIYEKEDMATPGSVILDITVDKKEKVKVRNIIVKGNEALSLNQIDRAMKKTHRSGYILNIFKSKKFIPAEYAKDKDLVIAKYNEVGHRDARLLSDSVVKVNDGQVDIYLNVEEGKKYYFGDLTWSGNTLYPSEVLTAMLNIRRGDVFNQTLLDKRLFQDEDAVGSLYKDNGYLFFNIDPVETTIDGDSINFEMRLYEGKPATINNITINGNDRVYEHVIRRELRTRPGALYSQNDLIRSIRDIAQMKLFDEEALSSGIDIQPNQEDGTVDITYNLQSKSSDQFEFSAGWGQQGPVISVGVKFTNFAIQNLFKKNMYRIVPQGEGQTLSLKVQTNAVYYQNYSISFFEPWLGGKRPNSLSLSLYYAIQTGLSQRYQEAYYQNYDNYYSYNNYGSQYSTAEYDSGTQMRTLGFSAGIGTRLNWPDDYFTLYSDVSFQHYNLKNWYKYYFGFENGIANNLSVGVTLGRNSIDNPIYTRRGSTFSLSARATPPYSVFTNIDYATATEAQRLLWVEYYKIKFNAKMFTPLSKDEKLVLMTRIEYGFLGYYNKNKRSPFEKFYVGGDGMSGYTTSGTDIVGLRGYASGALTPQDASGNYNGNLYTRLSVELRYPVLLNQSTTIWALAFLEAGNCWAEFKNFNPFDLKRSAGVGVRVYLPMFGLLGVDWGYGFDAINGVRTSSGSQFAFVLGQEF